MEEVNSGDIIVITKLKSQGETVGMHSFVVLSSENGTLCGIDYDFIALMMSSLKMLIKRAENYRIREILR